MSMLQLIKKAAMDAVEASQPVAILYGTIKEITPFEVEVDQRFLLPEEFFIFTDATKELKLEIGDREYIIRPKLKIGDKLILLRTQGNSDKGVKYVILDRVRQP